MPQKYGIQTGNAINPVSARRTYGQTVLLIWIAVVSSQNGNCVESNQLKIERNAMGLFDMFDGKKSRLAEAGDQLLENAARTTGEIFEKPVREKRR